MTKTEKDKPAREPLEASDANAAARAEAAASDDPTEVVEPSTIRTVDFGGQEWQIDVDGDGWPIEAGLAFSKILNLPPDQPSRATEYFGTWLEAVLGPMQWARFKSTPGRRTSDIRAMFDAIMIQAYGASAGE